MSKRPDIKPGVTGVGRSRLVPHRAQYQRPDCEGFQISRIAQADAGLKRVQKSWAKRWGGGNG